MTELVESVESKTSKQVGLHIHSENSFLDGFSKTDHIAQRAKELGQHAVALTDHGEVGGHLQFAKSCEKFEVKPLFGMEGYWAPDIQWMRDNKNQKNSHLTLIAKNQKGLSNLWAWSSKAYRKENFYSKPLADPKLMREYGKGLYASDGCLLTEFARQVLVGDESRARQMLGILLDIFGGRFFMELHTFQIVDPVTEEDRNLNREMTILNQAKVRFAKELGVPLVVVNDAHYAWPEHWENHQLVWGMGTSTLDQAGKGQAAAHIMGDDELFFWMSNHGISRSVVEEAINNSWDLANSCEEIKIGKTLEMPRLTGSDEDDLKLFLRHVELGFKKKVEEAGLDIEVYGQRMKEEVDLISSKNFAGYFNLVADYCKAAKSGSYLEFIGKGQAETMLVGPSRGSAGGSLVAFLMDITEIDPLRYDLLFGRFLSPSRKGYPDVDLDFQQSRRGDLKDYLSKKYGGEDHVCAIGTRSKLNPKGALADLCRAMKIDWSDKEKMSKIVAETTDIDTANMEVTWDMVLENQAKELAPWISKYPKLFEKMGEMVGVTRQSSTHAAGVLISSTPLTGNLPTRIKAEMLSTQWDMYEVEDMGGIKFDILGIRHLDTLEVARRLIQERHGVWLDYYNWTEEQYNDPDIWPQIDRGDTLGIFQLEAPSMTGVSKLFKPRSERDVADLISVNRPGVVRAGMLHHYLRRRDGNEVVELAHPLLKDITGRTYGVMVYQEQGLRVVLQLAGFTVDEAENVRKIMGKMLYDKMLELEPKFIQGCLDNPEFIRQNDDARWTPEDCAKNIWEQLKASGIYSFNEAHAVGYALVTAWEVWVKHHYYIEFLTALLITDEEKTNLYLREARKKGIQILPPDVNESNERFTLVGDSIRYGLGVIKQVGPSAVTDIQAKKPFLSFQDYLERATRSKMKQVAVALIKIGAFDRFGERGALLRRYYDFKIWETITPKRQKEWTEQQVKDYTEAYYASHKDDFPFFNFNSEKVVYEIEKELVGSWITRDPMSSYSRMIDNVCVSSPSEVEQKTLNEVVYIGGQITKVKKHTTRKGDPMAFIALTWNDETYDITVFPDVWQKYNLFIKLDVPVACACLRLEQGVCLSSLERLDML